jgi:hypothetical protein
MTQADVCPLIPDPTTTILVPDLGTGKIVTLTKLEMCTLEAAVEPPRPALDQAGLAVTYTYANGQVVVTYHNAQIRRGVVGRRPHSVFISGDVVPVDEALARIAAVR